MKDEELPPSLFILHSSPFLQPPILHPSRLHENPRLTYASLPPKLCMRLPQWPCSPVVSTRSSSSSKLPRSQLLQVLHEQWIRALVTRSATCGQPSRRRSRRS